jgi:L-aminopeptidase/D-esterase-like protein
MADGDTIFGLSTGHDVIVEHRSGGAHLRSADTRHRALNLILAAAAEVFSRACTHAIISATWVGGPPAFADLCPSALRR